MFSCFLGIVAFSVEVVSIFGVFKKIKNFRNLSTAEIIFS